jgi:hypothetical protein
MYCILYSTAQGTRVIQALHGLSFILVLEYNDTTNQLVD